MHNSEPDSHKVQMIMDSLSNENLGSVYRDKLMRVKKPNFLEKVEHKVFPSEKTDCLREIQRILSEYDKESDIPITHEYWNLLNHYRRLR